MNGDIIAPDLSGEKLMESQLGKRPMSPLTLRILSLNIIVLAAVAMSLVILAGMREMLIRNELENLATETRLYAYALAVVSQKKENIDQTQLQQVMELINIRGEQKIIYSLPTGEVISELGDIPLRPAFQEKKDRHLNLLMRFFAIMEDMFSVEFSLPPFPGEKNMLTVDDSSVQADMENVSISAWSGTDGGLILSSYANVEANGLLIGKIHLLRRDINLETAFAQTRMDILRFLVFSLILTLAFSLYLASLIAHPLRRLAMAAEIFRLNRGADVSIPDMGSRNDEIGELSQAMRGMAAALVQRINSIEQFAADVAHELKNPLTSMKSAVETLGIAKKEEDKARLMEIILHDLNRMNRLISDISQASRLDAELTRDILMPCNLRNVIMPLLSVYNPPLALPEEGKVVLEGLDRPVVVMGQASRLAQVFDNLISNALSFSPPDKKVIVRVERNNERVKVVVEDEGQGIPANRLGKIFDRFYSERPTNEGFGLHSGLGLSIARQIIDAHGGTIHAENRVDANGTIIGARFVVRLRVPLS